MLVSRAQMWEELKSHLPGRGPGQLPGPRWHEAEDRGSSLGDSGTRCQVPFCLVCLTPNVSKHRSATRCQTDTHTPAGRAGGCQGMAPGSLGGGFGGVGQPSRVAIPPSPPEKGKTSLKQDEQFIF